eukprot:1195701-Prorocentrum_minimum.AAC.4
MGCPYALHRARPAPHDLGERAHVTEVLGLADDCPLRVPGAQVGQAAAHWAPKRTVVREHDNRVLSARGPLLVRVHALRRVEGRRLLVGDPFDRAVGRRAHPGRCAGPTTTAVARVLLNPHLRWLCSPGTHVVAC